MADSLQRQMEGTWSMYPLLALVKAQGPLAGRKTLAASSRRGCRCRRTSTTVFKTLVSESNRAGVSVYAVDSRGLQSRSDIQNSGAALRDAALTSMQQQMKGAADPTTAAEMQLMDTVDTSLRLNVQQGSPICPKAQAASWSPTPTTSAVTWTASPPISAATTRSSTRRRW